MAMIGVRKGHVAFIQGVCKCYHDWCLCIFPEKNVVCPRSYQQHIFICFQVLSLSNIGFCPRICQAHIPEWNTASTPVIVPRLCSFFSSYSISAINIFKEQVWQYLSTKRSGMRQEKMHHRSICYRFDFKLHF